MKNIILILITSLTLYGESGWYFSDNCESIKKYSLQTPLQLISEYGCKPNMNKNTESSADMGMLAFDCSKTDLKGYMNVIFTKERCLQLKKHMEKR
jgi:hypothetical protein